MVKVRIPINSVVLFKGEYRIYSGVLNDKHSLLDPYSGDFLRIEKFEYEGLIIIRYPVELAAEFIASHKGGDNE